MPKRIVVVDYGVGNLFSVKRALEVSGATEIIISANSNLINQAEGLVLPGVGAFADGIRGLQERNLVDPLKAFARSRRPMLGICLGMQMLAGTSEEFGRHDGLNLIPGEVVTIPRQSVEGLTIKVPFIGWSPIVPGNENAYRDSLLRSHPASATVYLVHSFHVIPEDPEDLLATYDLGGHRITAAIRRDNITGLQFHPEKSGRTGLEIIRQFVDSVREA